MTTPAQIDEIKALVKAGIIDVADSFMTTPSAELAAYVNGCGAADSKFDFVPDRIWGLDIFPACGGHDWDYFEGKTHEDKEVADRRLRNNLLRLIELVEGWRRLVKPLMRIRAQAYYKAVDWRGGPAFWKGKNKYG